MKSLFGLKYGKFKSKEYHEFLKLNKFQRINVICKRPDFAILQNIYEYANKYNNRTIASAFQLYCEHNYSLSIKFLYSGNMYSYNKKELATMFMANRCLLTNSQRADTYNRQFTYNGADICNRQFTYNSAVILEALNI